MKTNNILPASLLSLLMLAACGGNDEQQQPVTPPPAAADAAPAADPLQAAQDPAQSPRARMMGNRLGNTTGVTVKAATFTQADLDYIAAIKEGNARRVRSMLESGKVSVHSGDQTGTSGLIFASRLKNNDVTSTILDNVTQGDVKVLDRNDPSAKTPIYHAAETGNSDVITLLRKKGANPNIYNIEQNFPLLIAVRNNDLESVKALVKSYSGSPAINLDQQNSDGESAVLAATKKNNREILSLLKESGANMNNFDTDGITPLIYAVSKNDKELFDYILTLGADINYLGIGKKTPLLYAVENKNYDFAKYILDKGANPNTHVKDLASPLQLAVSIENADADIVAYLIAKGAALTDPTIPLGNVIGRSIHKGNAPAITKLIAGGARVIDLEDKNNNGLLEALNADDAPIALLMINSGADLNKIDTAGYSALALATKKKFKDVVGALISHGADVNQTTVNPKLTPLEIVIENDDGAILDSMFTHGLKTTPDTLLMRAVNNKSDNIIPVLLKNGANPNISNTVGETPLHIAIGKDDNVAAKALIDSKATLDTQNTTNGLTPLSVAVNKDNAAIVQYLLEKGANPNIADSNGFTSLAYAAATGKDEMVKLLVAHKANTKAVNKDGASITQLIDLSKLPDDKKAQIKQLLTPPPAAQ